MEEEMIPKKSETGEGWWESNLAVICGWCSIFEEDGSEGRKTEQCVKMMGA